MYFCATINISKEREAMFMRYEIITNTYSALDKRYKIASNTDFLVANNITELKQNISYLKSNNIDIISIYKCYKNATNVDITVRYIKKKGR